MVQDRIESHARGRRLPPTRPPLPPRPTMRPHAWRGKRKWRAVGEFRRQRRPRRTPPCGQGGAGRAKLAMGGHMRNDLWGPRDGLGGGVARQWDKLLTRIIRRARARRHACPTSPSTTLSEESSRHDHPSHGDVRVVSGFARPRAFVCKRLSQALPLAEDLLLKNTSPL